MIKSNILIRRIFDSEWQVYKELRLNALRLAPEAFGTKLEEARLRPDSDWRKQVLKFSGDAHSVCLLMLVDERPMGMVSCYIQDQPEMVQMWIDPSVRGQDLGKELVCELKKWVKQAGHHSLLASVFKSNVAALGLYEGLGFLRVGESGLEIHLRCEL